MRESVFRFKQFNVRNRDSAMKVGTDGVLLGAWANVTDARRILDIGTGTGLLALMAAQRSTAMIDAIEIDEKAAEEAAYNAGESQWHDRITVRRIDFNEYKTESLERYDVIISNPPFFDNGITSPDAGRRQARHCDTLTFHDLLYGAALMLAAGGKISIITPIESAGVIEGIAKDAHLYVSRKTNVIPKAGAAAKRILWEFTNVQQNILEDSLTIENEARHEYTKEYIKLTREFYLKM